LHLDPAPAEHLQPTARPKTARSKRDVIVHEGPEAVLRAHMPSRPAPDDFAFTTTHFWGRNVPPPSFVKASMVPLPEAKLGED